MNIFPERILKLLGSADVEPITVGMSAADVYKCGELYIKHTPFHVERSYIEAGHRDEAAALEWLQGKLQVPELIDRFESDTEGWIVTRALDGESLLSAEGDPELVLRIMTEGLETLAAVDVTICPLEGYQRRALGYARENAERMGAFPENKEEINTFDTPLELHAWLVANQPTGYKPQLVHGDYCLPNIFFKDGHFSGVLDLAWCGVGDQNLDIALGWRSLGMNGYDQNLARRLCAKLGIEFDEPSVKWYTLLDELF